MKLTRRTFLRAAGVSLALPLLETQGVVASAVGNGISLIPLTAETRYLSRP